MNATEPVAITSLGKVCAELQRPITAIRRAADRLGIVPAIVINDVPHYAASDVERIAEHLNAGARQ
jgi:hypothetical protein